MRAWSSLTLFALALLAAAGAAVPSRAAGAAAANIAGEYLGSYKPAGHPKNTLELAIEAPDANGHFAGSSFFKLATGSETFDVDGTVRTHVVHGRSVTTVKATLTQMGSGNDTVHLTGTFTKKKHRIAGTFTGHISGRSTHGSFKVFSGA